jgi:hypothetical protein
LIKEVGSNSAESERSVATELELVDFLIKEVGSNSAESERSVATELELVDFLIKEEGSNSAESERSVATELELVMCNMRCPGWVLECTIAARKPPCLGLLRWVPHYV